MTFFLKWLFFLGGKIGSGMEYTELLARALALGWYEMAHIGVLWMIPSCNYGFIDATI